jgi:hypothetical protein
MADSQKHRVEEARAFAKAQGAVDDFVGYVDDAWGGYWQCKTKYGPYTFRLRDQDVKRR